jgi:PAS domain S-box-containing protein
VHVNDQITRQAWEASPLAILTLDHGGVVRFVNPAGVRILARDEVAIVGQSLAALAHPLDGLALSKMLEVAREGKVPERQELRFRRPDETDVATGFSVAPSSDGAPYTVCVLRDLSREKVLRPQLLHTERMASMGLVASVVAHELNNALAGAIGCLELLQPDMRMEQRELVQTALQELHRSAQIVGDIKGYARSEESMNQHIDVQDLIESFERLHRYHLGHDDPSHLSFDLPEVPCSLEGNKNQLLQALLNLVRNAEDAVRGLPEERQGLRLHVATERDIVHLSVIDQGPGVPEDSRARLFDPFYSTKAAGAGTGLGLSVVQAVAAGHGGRAEILDTPGGGATFRLTLPVSAPAPRSEPPPAMVERGPAPIRLNGARLLVADDESAIRRVFERAGSRLGAELVTVDSATSAIAALEAAPFDLVLLDVRMPGGGGPAVFRFLRRHRPELASRTIFMSGELSPDMNEIRGEDYFAILPKPFKVAQLADLLGRALSGERAG